MMGAMLPPMSATDPSTLYPIIRAFVERAHAAPDRRAFTVYAAGGIDTPTTITWGEWLTASRTMALALLRSGVQHGDRVAVLSRNRPLWPIADMAIQMIGAIGVGIYPTSAPAQIDSILRDCSPVLLLVDTLPHAALLAGLCAGESRRLPIVSDVSADELRRSAAAHAGMLVPLASWLHASSGDRGGELTPAPRALADDTNANANALDARMAAVTLDDPAALIYTSGSTGEPKGACISHRYLAASAASVAATLGFTAHDRTLSFLPYSHAAERVFGECTRVLTGMEAALIEDPADLFRVAAAFAPSFLGGLPRIFERLYEAAEVARRDGADPRAAIVARIGDRCRLATSGGAALPQHVAESLRALGLQVVGAYGQTEHLCVAMNRPDDVRFDTVGPPMPGTEVRLADDGELLVRRNALTFAGYWQNTDTTHAAFTDDGLWLRTGDRAELLPGGELRIVGRVKEMIALSNGRKIAPLPIEAALVASPFIAHAVCHGEGRKYLVVLLSLRRQVVEAWARQHGLVDQWPTLAEHAALRAELQAAIDGVNATLARTDRVQAYAITTQEFSHDTGDLTPTLKLVRAVIDQRFADTFERMYS